MAKRIINSVKLGAFVLAGLLFLVLLLYMIGKDENLFGDNYVLKVRFENIQGVVAGNNVRYSGIQAGTVKKVKILNDTVIEITMIIDTKMESIIRKNAIVSIGTDGLVGNKIINITPAHYPSPLAQEGDILASKKPVDTDEMLQTLSKTNKDIAVISTELKTTVQKINTSNGLWKLLNDEAIPKDVRLSVANIHLATGKANNLVTDLQTVVTDLKKGKGSAGALLRDTSIAKNLNDAIIKINDVAKQADILAHEITQTITDIKQDINFGKGTANAILKDSQIVIKLNASLDNIQKGTDGFNQNMEALKHNFLFRGYFRKLERQKVKGNQ